MSCWKSFAAVLGALAIALVAAAPQARAAIAVVNQIGDGLGNAGTIGGAPWEPASPYYNLSQPFTVTGGDVLVVELSDRQNLNATALPTGLTWNGVTLNEAVTQVSTALSYRLVATYWAPISVSTATTANIAGTIPDGTDLTGSWLTAFTLSGVNTSIFPLTASTDAQATSEALTVNNVVAGSYAAVNYVFGNTGYTVNVSGSSGTATLWTQNTQGSSSTDQGYVANLSGGSNTFTASAAGTGAASPYKSPLTVAVFTPLAPSFTWSGSTNNSWSLAGSDANWTGLGTAYADGSPVTFSDSGTHTNPINIASGGVQPSGVIFTNNSTLYSFTGGAISGSAAVSLGGSGMVTFDNANSYSGATTIGGGTLQLGDGSSGHDGSLNTSGINNGGALLYNVFGSQTVNYPISGNGPLTKAGAGLVSLVGNGITYTGNTTVSGGTLQFYNTRNFSNGSLPANTFSIAANAVLEFYADNTSSTTDGANQLLGTEQGSGSTFTGSGVFRKTGNGTLAFNHSDALACSVAISGTGNLLKAGSGTLTLCAANTFSGGTTVRGGTLKLVGGQSGFGGSGLGWTVNSNGISSTPITNNVLTLTDNNLGEARSAFYNTPVSAGPFTASFIYQAGGAMQADGVAFVLQNDSRGLSALGGGGQGLGYSGITPSAAIQFNIQGAYGRGQLSIRTAPPGATIRPRASALPTATPFWPF